MLAGYCNNVLAAMNPHRLDLTTWRWVRESGLVPNPGHGDALALPSPRQRAAAETVGDKWLLVLGGSPTQVWDKKRTSSPYFQGLVHCSTPTGLTTILVFLAMGLDTTSFHSKLFMFL